MKTRPLLLGATLRALLVGACLMAGCVPEAPPDRRPMAVVSVLPQRFVVEAIAGDRVRVEVMIPPGASPATYEPTVRQMLALGRAALYLKVGHPNFPFESTWLDRLLAELPGLRVVDGSRGQARPEEDPHLWLVPRHVEGMAEAVVEALEELLPDEREALRTNLAVFRARLEALDREIRSALAGYQGAEFFVFHPAWGSFAQEYGLRQVAVEHERKEPDPYQLAELIAHARASKARVIFVQPQLDQASAETVARETGARVEVLDPLAEDWDGNLRRATRALVEGLSG